MWGWHGHEMSAWTWWVMTAAMVFLWALVVWLTVTVVRQVDTTRRSTPDDILAERFARGEISEDEYQRRRDLIRR